MPEYLAPGVYVEETSFRSKSIEGVSTTTTGFVGPCRYGPLDLIPDVVTSLGEFERVYGDGQPLDFGEGSIPNYLWHATRAFFEEGGKRLYVSRVYAPPGGAAGVAKAGFGAGADAVTVAARFPGKAGNGRLTVTLQVGPNGLTRNPADGKPGVRGLLPADVVWVGPSGDAPEPVRPAPAGPPASTVAGVLIDLDKTKAGQIDLGATLTSLQTAYQGLAADPAKQAAAGRVARKAAAVVAANAAARNRWTDVLDQARRTADELKGRLTELSAETAAAGAGVAADAQAAADADNNLQAERAAIGNDNADIKAVADAVTALRSPDAADKPATWSLKGFDDKLKSDIVARAKAAADAVQALLDALTVPAFAGAGKDAATAQARADQFAVGVEALLKPPAAAPAAPAAAAGPAGRLYVYRTDGTPRLVRDADAANDRKLADLDPAADTVRPVTLAVTLDAGGRVETWAGLPPDPTHKRAGEADAFSAVFAPAPANEASARTIPLTVTLGANVKDGVAVLRALFGGAVAANAAVPLAVPPADADLTGGSDGAPPGPTDYEGKDDQARRVKTGLVALTDIEDISIVAAPGSSAGSESDAQAVANALIGHAERMRYRIAVLDARRGESVGTVRAYRGQFDSTYAALYYPWVKTTDPVTRGEILLPPSGFVAGIYARNDINRGVWKAPANEVVTLALGFEATINKAQQEVLNPAGVNCLRFFEGRGNRVWGARTVSSDPEWKYVNLRRYFAYLERSIDKGTQFAVFEPNGDLLWANIRRTIGDFLLNEWQQGALLGDRPDKAYFVKCDRSTMSQNDLDNGRLICLIGVAPLRPAEFVIFRVGQWTADAKS